MYNARVQHLEKETFHVFTQGTQQIVLHKDLLVHKK